MISQKGITLIAVIITVIVMLILTGVSVGLTVGNNGILKNTETASEKSERSEVKEYVLESWAYVISKIEDNEMPYENDTAGDTSNSTKAKKADKFFRNYISSYGTGYLESENGNYVYSIKIKNAKDPNKKEPAYKIVFKLKGNRVEEQTFYIVGDTNVYLEDEVSK